MTNVSGRSCKETQNTRLVSNNFLFHQNHAIYEIHTLNCRMLAIIQYPEVPATGHLATGSSWIPSVYKRMLRWFPRLQVATACFSCSPPDLNFLDPYFIFMHMHYNHCHRATAHLQLYILLYYIILCYVVLCCVALRCVTLRYVMLCYIKKLRGLSPRANYTDRYIILLYYYIILYYIILYYIYVEKYYTAGQATDDNITRRMRFECWKTEATDRHPECFLLFPGNNG